MYDPNGLFQLLEPIGNGAFGFFDDERCAVYVPVTCAPKGSARAIPILGPGKVYRGMRFINGSGDSTAKKLKEMEDAVREAIARLCRLGFEPYDSACHLDMDAVFLAPKIRRTEKAHITYPDRDKLLRACQDFVAPPRKDKAPQMDQPHLVVNDSYIHGGYANKWWLHVWNEITGLKDDGDGVYIQMHY